MRERFALDCIHRQRVLLSLIPELFSLEIVQLAAKSRILLRSENRSWQITRSRNAIFSAG